MLKFAKNYKSILKIFFLKQATLILVFIIAAYSSNGQHIQYRDKRKPVETKSEVPSGENAAPIPVPENKVTSKPVDSIAKPVVIVPEKKPIAKDTIAKILPSEEKKIIPEIPVPKTTIITTDTVAKKADFIKKPKLKKPYVEEQNMCNLSSLRPELAAQLPLVINNVTPEMLKFIKERYIGRLYSITGLNMIDRRLKYKLKICDSDNGKFRSEYLDKNGNVVKDPALDYE